MSREQCWNGIDSGKPNYSQKKCLCANSSTTGLTRNDLGVERVLPREEAGNLLPEPWQSLEL